MVGTKEALVKGRKEGVTAFTSAVTSDVTEEAAQQMAGGSQASKVIWPSHWKCQ